MEPIDIADHGIVVFAIATMAFALVLSVLGLATTRRTRAEIRHEFRGLS